MAGPLGRKEAKPNSLLVLHHDGTLSNEQKSYMDSLQRVYPVPNNQVVRLFPRTDEHATQHYLDNDGKTKELKAGECLVVDVKTGAKSVIQTSDAPKLYGYEPAKAAVATAAGDTSLRPNNPPPAGQQGERPGAAQNNPSTQPGDAPQPKPVIKPGPTTNDTAAGAANPDDAAQRPAAKSVEQTQTTPQTELPNRGVLTNGDGSKLVYVNDHNKSMLLMKGTNLSPLRLRAKLEPT